MRISHNLYRAGLFLRNLFFATVIGVALGTLLHVTLYMTEGVSLEQYEQNRTRSRIVFFYNIKEAQNSCRDHLFGTLTDYNGYKEVYVCTALERTNRPAE